VFAYGVSVCELFVESAPWPATLNESDVKDSVNSGERPAVSVAQVLQAMLRRIAACWAGNAARRPEFTVIASNFRLASISAVGDASAGNDDCYGVVCACHYVVGRGSCTKYTPPPRICFCAQHQCPVAGCTASKKSSRDSDCGAHSETAMMAAVSLELASPTEGLSGGRLYRGVAPACAGVASEATQGFHRHVIER
jgi:hypothetical protein